MSGVYKKEMRSYRVTMVGYVIAAFILAVIGIYFSYTNLNLASPQFENVFKNVQFLFVIIVPILTMRVLAEERRQRTDQLLLTLPLRIWEIMLGKYLALVTVFAVPVALIFTYPFILVRYGTVNLPVALFTVLGFFLLGCAELAIGMFCSSLTENPVIAAVAGFGTLLLCYLIASIKKMIPNTAIGSLAAFLVVIAALALVIWHVLQNFRIGLIAGIVGALIPVVLFMLRRPALEGSFQRALSVLYLNGRLTGFYEGLFDLGAVVYYLSVIVIALVLTGQTIARRRWSQSGRMGAGKGRMLAQGSFSLLTALLTITGVVIVNLIVARLPLGMTQIDLSSAKLYTLTDTTLEYLSQLEQEVTLYHICEGGEEDDAVTRLLSRYEEASPHITAAQVDPGLYPGFVSQYTDERVENNSVIVAGDKRSRVIHADDMYTLGTSSMTGRVIETGFDGEGLLTGALGYVTSDAQPVLYVLSANGEVALGEEFAEAARRNNVEIRELNLLTAERVPEDAACILMAAPARDYTVEETGKILDYLESGGNGILLTNYSMEAMPRLDSILSDYGLARQEGIILEGDSAHYISYQYCLIPEVNYTQITAKVYGGVYLLLPMAQGISTLDTYRASISMQPLLVTSAASYDKVDVQNMTTSEKEEGDIDGPFTVGMLAAEDIDRDGAADTQLLYISTGYFLDEDYNKSVSGGNAQLFGDAVSLLCAEDERLTSVPVKNLQAPYLAISDRAANTWTVICVFVLPGLFVLAGVLVWQSRRKR